MEIAGAALGTLIARIFELLFICGFFFYRDKRTEYRVRYLLTPYWELMNSISLIVVFQAMNSILTKEGLRAGGDTKFLMTGDILFLWVTSIPLGALARLVMTLLALLDLLHA